MGIIFNIFLFMFGSIIGSFYNVLIYRLPQNIPFIKGRSFCPTCHHTLNFGDLIPIVSYFLRKGRCHYCQTRISFRYPLVEIITGCIFVLFASQFGNTSVFYKYFLFFSAMLILFFTDFEKKIIPDSISLGIIGLGFAFGLYESQFWDSFWGAITGFLIYFIISVLAIFYYKKEALGGGDVKLGAGIGAFWGVKIAIVSSYLSFMVGGLIAIILILTKLKKKTDYIPFAPAMIISNIISLFFLDLIWKFYFG